MSPIIFIIAQVFAADMPASAAASQPTTLSKLPKLTHPVDPLYPPEAIAARASAQVLIAIDIDDQGHVTNATLVEEKAANRASTLPGRRSPPRESWPSSQPKSTALRSR